MTAVRTVGEQQAHGQRRTLVVACASTTLVLTTFVTPLATLGRTAADLDAGTAAQAWLLSSISVGLAAALLSAGALGDARGRRQVFLGGLAVLALGAAACALAPTPRAFIAGRLLQGLGGAAVIACALGLIGHAFPLVPERVRATGVWGASIGVGTGTGGVLTLAIDHGDRWRGAYWLTAALALLLAVLGRTWLTESRAAVRRPPDLLGAGLLGLGLSALLGGLVESRQDAGTGTALLVAGGLLLAAFAVVESCVRAPMLELGLLRRPQFAAVSLAALFTGVALIGLFSFLPSVMQQGLGDSLLAPTLLIALWAGISAVVAWHVKRLPVRLGGRARLVTGLVAVALGVLTLTGLTPESTGWRLVPGMVVTGAAYGLLNATLGREAVASVPPDRVGMGSGANNTARYVGSALGVSLVVVLATRSGRAPAELVAGWNTAVLVCAGAAVLGAVAVGLCRPRRP